MYSCCIGSYTIDFFFFKYIFLVWRKWKVCVLRFWTCMCACFRYVYIYICSMLIVLSLFLTYNMTFTRFIIQHGVRTLAYHRIELVILFSFFFCFFFFFYNFFFLCIFTWMQFNFFFRSPRWICNFCELYENSESKFYVYWCAFNTLIISILNQARTPNEK